MPRCSASSTSPAPIEVVAPGGGAEPGAYYLYGVGQAELVTADAERSQLRMAGEELGSAEAGALVTEAGMAERTEVKKMVATEQKDWGALQEKVDRTVMVASANLEAH